MESTQAIHEHWMQEALLEASFAAAEGEVPVGAVAICGNELIAKAHNRRELTQDPLGHAELLLLKRISKELGSWRLEEVTLYVTCEPCVMCMGALIQARIPRLIYGCSEPKTGACGSLYDFSQDHRLNHRIEVVSGILEELCATQMTQFFKNLRIAQVDRRTNYE